MLEEFSNELNTDEKNDTKKMYESDNPSVFEADEVSTKRVSSFTKRQKGLSENSRTSTPFFFLFHCRCAEVTEALAHFA